MEYNPHHLENISILIEEDNQTLEKLSDRVPLKTFLSVKRNVDSLGIDFIHSSSK